MEAQLFEEMERLQDEHWWFCGRRHILGKVIESLGLPAKARILELGAGTGSNFPMLSRFGDLTAVEADDFARSRAAVRLGRPVASGTLPFGLPTGIGRFDLVCMLDVLEHIEQDVDTLRVLPRLLSPGGQVLVTVPAHRWLFGAHDRAHHHRRRYSAADLRAKAVEAGLTVTRIGYFNAFLFPLALVARLFEREGRASRSTADRLPPRALNRVLRGIFSAEAGFVSRRGFPFGLSLLAVLRPDVAAQVAAADARATERETRTAGESLGR